MAKFHATFEDGTTATYHCNNLSEGLRAAGETRQPVKVTVTDMGKPQGKSYPMTKEGIKRAMLHAKEPARAQTFNHQ